MMLENLLDKLSRAYDRIIIDYNKEKDRNTIEATFEALMRLTADKQRKNRYAEEGLTSEKQLAIFDMLKKSDLKNEEIKKIKAVSVELLTELEKYLKDVQEIFSKQSTSDGFRQKIYDFLYDDKTGVPITSYDDKELHKLTEQVFFYFKNSYSTSLQI